MTVEVKDWTMPAFTDRTLRVEVKVDGAVVSISGWSFRMEIKENDEIATTAFITKSTDVPAEAFIYNASDALVDFLMTPADFDVLAQPKYGFRYAYGINGTNPAGKIYEVQKGKVVFTAPLFVAGH